MSVRQPLGFRTDINGLRAWAVSLVMLFHFNVPGFKGGFVGVDVFFVISGYLMTAIVLTGLNAQAGSSFSLVGFYRSRAARIVPALLFFCLVLLLAGWFVLLPGQLVPLVEHVTSALWFYSNVLFWQQAGYFSPSAHENWLLHTWSLSVEWQFYLIYPLILLMWWVAGLRKHLGSLLWVLFGTSLLCSMWTTPRMPEAAFYLLPARAWEMLAGALVYVYTTRVHLKPGWAGKLELLGFCAIVLAAIAFDGEDGWPGYRGLLPVAGTILVLLSNRSGVLTGTAVAQWVGLRSYSIYLWHWPFVVGLTLYGYSESLLWLAVSFVLSFVLGDLSYRFVERGPRRWLVKTRPAHALGVVAGLIAVITGAAWKTVEYRQQAAQGDEAARSAWLNTYTSEAYHASLIKPYREECNFYDNPGRYAKAGIDESCTAGSGGGVFLWGDSHAQALAPGIGVLLQEIAPDTELYQVATSACAPALADMDEQGNVFKLACARSNRYAIEQINRLRPRMVIMAQASGHDKSDYRAIVDWLRQQGVAHAVLVGPVPQWRPSLPQVIVERHWDGPNMIADQALDASIMQLEQRLEQLQQGWQPLHYVSVIGGLCEQGRCLAMLPGEQRVPLVFDYGHLTPEGSVHVARQTLRPVLEPLLMESLPAPDAGL